MSPPRLSLKPGLLLTGDGEALFITDTSEGLVYEINATCHFIVDQLREGVSADEIAARLRERHPEVAIETVRQDVEELIQALLQSGLVVPA